MNTTSISAGPSGVSVKRAALVGGLGLLLMVLTAPIAEMYLLPKLIESDSPAQTFQNISTQENILVASIFLYLTTFIADIVVAWALFIFFKPFNRGLSLLTAWFRLIYTAMALTGLFNLLKVLELAKKPEYLRHVGQDDLATQAMFHIRSFGQQWGISFIFFGICLILLGYMAYKANYVPRIIGGFLILAGAGYLLSSLKPYFFPEIDTSILMVTFFGEIVFMFWLLIKGTKINLEP